MAHWTAARTVGGNVVRNRPGEKVSFSMTVLDDIVAGVRQDLAVREQATPLAEVK